MGQLVISGTLTIGPSACGTGVFPTSTDTVTLDTTPSPKTSIVASGTISRYVTSPSSYVTLSGVGATDTVTKGDTLFFRCDAAVKLRFVQADPAGGSDITSVINVQGMLLQEFPLTGYLKTLEVMGTARLEYAFSGLQ